MKIFTLLMFLAFSSSAFSAADVVKKFSCVISLGAVGGGFVITNNTHSVVTPSGNTVLKCTADIPAPLVPNRAINEKNFLCNTYLGLTTDTKKTFTAGGKVHLTCTIKH